ncbi:uncharacterized protein LOC142334300 isoform X1 [Lycorma delicatula]|uniref:uncharacterized protein LOC142334300 isoform X1 n=1 Tax=Lycorma delicatula TaxID=130591 RepID=UPI003F50F552
MVASRTVKFVVLVLTVTTATKDDRLKYRTFYEGKWNPQKMIKWIKDHALDPHEMFQALHLIKNEPVKFASESIIRNFRLRPIHIEMMLKDLNLNAVDAYEALFAWEQDPAVTVAYKACFNDMSPKRAQAEMKDEVFSSLEEEMENNYVPEILKRLVKLYRNESWSDFNIKAQELKMKVVRRKEFLKVYEPVQTIKKEHPLVFRAIRRFMLKGHTAGPNVTVPTIGRKLRHQDCRDLYDIHYTDTKRYRLLQNVTTFAQSFNLRPFEKIPAVRIRNVKRYYDSFNDMIIECEKIIRHSELDDGFTRKVETRTHYIYANDDRFLLYLNATGSTTVSTQPSCH